MEENEEFIRREVGPEAEKGFTGRENEEKHRLEEVDRIQVVLDILNGKTTPAEVQKRYGISIYKVYSWTGKYISQESLSLQDNNEESMAKKSKDEQIRELKAALKKSRKEAELEKLRAHAYDTMINLAEEKFNIPIRKKAGTKQ